jgi:hypothetical protein
MSASESKSGLVLQLAEEFLERYRQGERPSLKEYIDRHPQLAAEIKEVFPAMALMENVALAEESLTSAVPGIRPGGRQAASHQRRAPASHQRRARRQRRSARCATDDPLHGHQEGRFFHGYYKEFCYLPLYIFCGEYLLVAKLRTANNDASSGTVAELERVLPQIRAAWPQVRILVRADSGFCREEIMAWCEAHDVDYLFGLAKNSRLVEALAPALADAQARYLQTGVAARVFTEFDYQTRDSWSRARRVVGKAEYLPKGPNPRFVVTSQILTVWSRLAETNRLPSRLKSREVIRPVCP